MVDLFALHLCLVRVDSCDFVDRFLFAAKKSDPRNHTNEHEVLLLFGTTFYNLITACGDLKAEGL